MKTFEALYIDKEGTVRYNLFPEEPKLCFHFKPDNSHHCEHSYNVICECNNVDAAYQKALASAKESAIMVSDQAQGRVLIDDLPSAKIYSCCQYAHSFYEGCLLLDSIHPLPKGWSVEIKEELYMDNAFRSRKVAVLSPIELKDESQEELWNDVLLVTDDPHRNYFEDGTILRYLQNNFSISRKKNKVI